MTPVFGTGGTVLAALEGTVTDVGSDLQPVRSALLVAAGRLSRELATVRAAEIAGSDPDLDPDTEPDTEPFEV